MDPENISESSKAVQEVSKAANSAIAALRDAGGYIGKHLDGPLEQMSLLVQDRLKYARATRLIRFKERMQQELNKRSDSIFVQPLDVNFALAALQEGIFEENNNLQDIWARLIANAIDGNSGATPRRSHISIIKDMSQLDALIFQEIYDVPDAERGKAIVTSELPNKAYRADQTQLSEMPEPNEEVKISLSNLERLGVIAFGATWGGGETFRFVNKTLAGRDLMKAIRK